MDEMQTKSYRYRIKNRAKWNNCLSRPQLRRWETMADYWRTPGMRDAAINRLSHKYAGMEFAPVDEEYTPERKEKC